MSYRDIFRKRVPCSYLCQLSLFLAIIGLVVLRVRPPEMTRVPLHHASFLQHTLHEKNPRLEVSGGEFALPSEAFQLAPTPAISIPRFSFEAAELRQVDAYHRDRAPPNA